MKSFKCPECGFVGWADAEACKKCGAALAAQPAEDAIEFGPDDQTIYYPPPPGGFQPDLKTGLATAAMVAGILNAVFLGIFGVTIVAGIVISVIALKKIKHQPLEYGGKSMAVAGLVLNIISTVVLIPVLVILAIALPNLYAARRAANEGSAIKSLRIIHAAEATYQSTAGRGAFGSLEDLRRQNLIPGELASGTRSGYRFKIEMVNDSYNGLPGFMAVAVPTDYGSTGNRSFFVDETGVIRVTEIQGMEASKYDAPLDDSPRNRSASRRSPVLEE
jgi:hypothetical protein